VLAGIGIGAIITALGMIALLDPRCSRPCCDDDDPGAK
jgi:hypothetical protein